MRLSQSVLTALLICITPAVFANVEVTLPSNSELVLVNGKESGNTDKLTLNNGENQLALRYSGRYQQQGSQTQFSSDVIILRFTAINSKLTLELPRIRSNSAADAFNREPEITLLDAAGDKVAFKQDKLIKEGMQLGRDYEAEINVYNSNAGIAAVAALSSTTRIATQTLPVDVSNKAQTENITKQADQVDVGKMLDFWYAQADEETKRAFKLRINGK